MPVPVFAKYQITQALPYFVKRWVLFRRDAHLEPLYKFGDDFDAVDNEFEGTIIDNTHFQ